MSDDELEQRARARVGRVLDDKFHLERLIGFGGMAAVYAARHRNGARAAVKVLHPDVGRDEAVRARFLQEGYAANKVEHGGAVRVLDDDVVKEGDDRGTAYIVMELLEGESVTSRAKNRGGRLAEAEVLAIAEGVLDVLEAAHARGIVHRDLKPDNLFLAREEGVSEGRDRVKVLDFGIARIAESAGRTAVGAQLGTPSYMAPEQARGQRDRIDGRTDLFALGATMFRLLTARRVHEADSAAEILGKMATRPAPPIRSVAPETSPAVAAIVDRALQFEQDARYANAAAMKDDVRAARAGQPLPSGSVPGSLGAPAGLGFSAGSDFTGIARDRTAATMAARPAGDREAPTVAAPASVAASSSNGVELVTGHTAAAPPQSAFAYAAPAVAAPPPASMPAPHVATAPELPVTNVHSDASLRPFASPALAPHVTPPPAVVGFAPKTPASAPAYVPPPANPPQAPPIAQLTPVPRRRSRGPFVVIVGVAVGLLLVGIVAGVTLAGRKSDPAETPVQIDDEGKKPKTSEKAAKDPDEAKDEPKADPAATAEPPEPPPAPTTKAVAPKATSTAKATAPAATATPTSNAAAAKPTAAPTMTVAPLAVPTPAGKAKGKGPPGGKK